MPFVPPFGVYPPLPTFFNADETIDYTKIEKVIDHVVKGGVTGLILQGSNGEAPHLLHDERQELIKRARAYVTKMGSLNLPLIAGCGAPSVRETLLYIKEAKDAGADYALVLPPAYYVGAANAAFLESFFGGVADASPLPVLIYNYPPVTGGIDLSSRTIIQLAKAHPNIVGAKLTCGDVGKLQRIASAFRPGSFAVYGGKSDFFLPGLVAGAHGTIAALANVVPSLHKKLLDLYQEGNISAAQEIQAKLSYADEVLMGAGVPGGKGIVEHYYLGGKEGRSRRPLPAPSVKALGEDVLTPLDVVVDLEQRA